MDHSIKHQIEMSYVNLMSASQQKSTGFPWRVLKGWVWSFYILMQFTHALWMCQSGASHHLKLVCCSLTSKLLRLSSVVLWTACYFGLFSMTRIKNIYINLCFYNIFFLFTFCAELIFMMWIHFGMFVLFLGLLSVATFYIKDKVYTVGYVWKVRKLKSHYIVVFRCLSSMYPQIPVPSREEWILCFCNPSDLPLHMLRSLSYFSAYHRCQEWLFELNSQFESICSSDSPFLLTEKKEFFFSSISYPIIIILLFNTHS